MQKELDEFTALLLEFFEVATHQILYVRKVYPPALFERRRKYGISARMGRHPELNNYIHTVFQSGSGWFRRGEVEKVVVAIINPSTDKPVERFVFDMEPWTPDEIMRRVKQDDPYLEKLEEDFRCLLLRIGTSDSRLKDNPPGCEFSVMLYTREPLDSTGNGGRGNEHTVQSSGPRSEESLCIYHTEKEKTRKRSRNSSMWSGRREESDGGGTSMGETQLQQYAKEREREVSEWVTLTQSESELSSTDKMTLNCEENKREGHIKPGGRAAEAGWQETADPSNFKCVVTPIKSIGEGVLQLQLFVEGHVA